MFYADTVGLAKVLARLNEFLAVHGKSWQPSTLLERLAREGRSFESLDANKGSTP
jgi:3-hydroxyacyl-CoA dehydrogenase